MESACSKLFRRQDSTCRAVVSIPGLPTLVRRHMTVPSPRFSSGDAHIPGRAAASGAKRPFMPNSISWSISTSWKWSQLATDEQRRQTLSVGQGPVPTDVRVMSRYETICLSLELSAVPAISKWCAMCSRAAAKTDNVKDAGRRDRATIRSRRHKLPLRCLADRSMMR